jgi:hypothetical protein
MRKLTVRQKDGSQKECGCTFTLAGGFVYTCDSHLRVAASLASDRKKASAVKHSFVPSAAKPRKKQKVDSPELVAAIVAECERRMEIARKERAKIRKPSSRLTPAERDHLHKFAFSAIEIRDEILKAGNPPA